MNIDDVINYGSPYLGLKHKLITIQQVIDYLVENEVNNTNLSMYINICGLSNWQSHTASTGKHLFYHRIEYLYVVTKLYRIDIVELPENIFSMINLDDIGKLNNSIVEIGPFCDKVLDGIINTPTEAAEYMPYMLEIRSPYTNYVYHHIPEEQYNKMVLTIDNPDLLSLSKEVMLSIFERLDMLSNNLYQYYKIILPYYKKYMLDYQKQCNFTFEFVRDNNESIQKHFPGIISSDVLDSNDKLLFFVRSAPLEIACYILGFPIQYGTPDRKTLDYLINLYVAKGRDKYLEHLIDINKKLPELLIPGEFVNTENVLMNEIDEYPNFDIIMFICDTIGTDGKSKIYRFTRSEFENIIKTGNNPWTNQKLPQSILFLIQDRIDIAKKYNLPNSDTLIELWKMIDEDKLVIPDGNSTTTQLTIPNIFQLFSTFAQS